MSELKYFVTYSQSLDCFVKVKKLEKVEIDAIFAVLDVKLSDSDYSIEEFTEFICKGLIHDYDKLVKANGKSNLLYESLYGCVVEVYPILTIESACMHFNYLAEENSPKFKEFAATLKDTESSNYKMADLVRIREKIEKNLIDQQV